MKYSPDQPRVPAGNGRESGRWTDGAGTGGEAAGDRPRKRAHRNTEGRVQVAQGPLTPLVRGIAPALGRLLTMTPAERMTAALAASAAAAQTGQVALHWMRAREGSVTREGELVSSQVVPREEAERVCRNLGRVQEMVDRHDREITITRPGLSGADHGRAVHTAVEKEINDRRIPGLETEQRLGPDHRFPGYRRADIIDRLTIDRIACLYDIKTGRDGWSTRDMLDYLRRAPILLREDGLYVAVEIRPRWRCTRR